MARTIEIEPVTRIEGHAKIRIDVGDDKKVSGAWLSVLEFRGFERFVQGMQVELIPTLMTRVCGTCPHAHHLAAAKAVDEVFSVKPTPAALLQRKLLNAGSMIHSHAVHFFALAGPDLLLGVDSPVAKRNVVGLLEIAPDLTAKALKLRSLGQRIVEIVGGRGTHPVTCIAGGMSAVITKDTQEQLQRLSAEALELAKVALVAGRGALDKNKDMTDALTLEAVDLGTVDGGKLDTYDGKLRARGPDGKVVVEFEAKDYEKYLYEEAFDHSYGKGVLLQDSAGKKHLHRVGPLSRLNAADSIDTPLAAAELEAFRKTAGNPSKLTVMSHYARLLEILHFAELCVRISSDPELISPNVRTKPTATPKRGIAHVEAPRGMLLHDFRVDSNGIVTGANLLVATQHNFGAINASLKSATEAFIDKPDAELLNRIEFAIRCYDPCLSCSTHRVGQMPLEVEITESGRVVRQVRR